MNEHDQSVPPPINTGDPLPLEFPESWLTAPPKPLSWWVRKLFACNPFYLVSAALLLYGCYRVSLDAPFLSGESARLLFNFSSVQCYEILVVFTAIFLARRTIWYDSTLLVALENMLVFVPFILISQAAFIDSRLALIMSLAGAAVAVCRFGALKRFFTRLNLPGRSLGAGFIVLALNVALPLIYRHFGETKIGVHIDAGPAYEMNERTWLLILPAVLALANFLPRAGGTGHLPPQHRWLPAGLFALWITVTGVHVYCLDYIYQFDLRPELFAPAAWVLAWTIWRGIPAESPGPVDRLKQSLAIVAVLVPLLALMPGVTHAFLILTALNIAAYLGLCRVERGHRLAQHLLYASSLMFLAGLPETWIQSVIPGLTTAGFVAGGAVGYLLFWIIRSRNSKVAVLGSILFGWTIGAVFGKYNGIGNWVFQSCLVFLLLHSLRWNEVTDPTVRAVRKLVALLWVLHSFFWMGFESSPWWMPCVPGLLTLAVYVVVQVRSGKWNEPVISVAAILVTLAGPGNVGVEYLRMLPMGLLAVIGSFMLFGLGTLAALTRSVWHKPEPAIKVADESKTLP